MNTNIEELLRDGMSRFTGEMKAPGGLAHTAVRLHRRRVTVRASAAGGCFAVVAATAVFLATGVTRTTAGPAPMQARDAAYVTKRVESALSGQDMVAVEKDSNGGATTTWMYGKLWNRLELNPPGDYSWVEHGKRYYSFPLAERGKPFTATGTAMVGGQLYGAYVTYNDDRYSLTPLTNNSVLPTSACSTTARLEMGGMPVPGVGWAVFINNTLRCGTASVTGQVRISGHETTQITGKPVTVRLSAGYAKAVQEKWATVGWTIYVNPKTFLPVRIDGSTRTYGGTAGNQVSAQVNDMTWLAPTPSNIAKALVTIPPGFHRYTGNPADQ
jgi:hypothetical protein